MLRALHDHCNCKVGRKENWEAKEKSLIIILFLWNHKMDYSIATKILFY